MPEKLIVDRLVGTLQSDTSLQLTNGTPQSLEAGTYIAVRQQGQEQGAYKLYAADKKGEKDGRHIASVYLTMRSDGVIEIG
jgi:hypothetical protein